MTHRILLGCGHGLIGMRMSPVPMCGCRTLFRTNSTGNLLQRAIKSVKNDPFIKLSLSLCALVVGGTVFMELYKKLKKNIGSTIAIYPPGFGHHSIRRESFLLVLHEQLNKLNSMHPEVPAMFYITGPRGCGKTELVRQFCKNYNVKKWFGLKTIPPTVVSFDATSSQLLKMSIEEVAYNLGIPQKSSPDDMLSLILAKLSSDHLPWLLVVDNLTKDANSLFRTLVNRCLSKTSLSQGSVLVTTQCSDLAVDECSLRLTPR